MLICTTKVVQGGVRTLWYDISKLGDYSSNRTFRRLLISDPRQRSATFQHEVIEAGENDSSPITWLCIVIVYVGSARQPPPRAFNPWNTPTLAMESSLSFAGRQVAVTVSLEVNTIGSLY